MEMTGVLTEFDSDLYLLGDDVGDRYSVDWSGELPHRPDVVFRPRSTEDVATMLKTCHAASQPIAVQGGLTGLSGGATPRTGEWSLSLERMKRVVELDTAAMTITVEAGTPLEVIQNLAEEAGLRFPLDLGARGSCVAGGVVSTNAGGNQVIEFGMARALVLGLTAVLADGTIIPAHNKLLKNNTGFDIKQLFIGSEGTLGVVTEVTFRLFPQKPCRQTALCAVDTFDSVIALLQQMGRSLDTVSAFEVMWSSYYQESLRAIDAIDPLGGSHPYYVLLETEGANEDSTVQTFQSALVAAMESDMVLDVAIAQSRSEEQAFWSIRDGIAEIMPDFGPFITVDVGIPITKMEAFATEVVAELENLKPGIRNLVFGHIGDGNLHMVATTGRSEDKDGIYQTIYRKTQEVGGAITAEHGVGTLKRRWLSYSRTEEEIALMRSLKNLLDPKNILNPGRVI